MPAWMVINAQMQHRTEVSPGSLMDEWMDGKVAFSKLHPATLWTTAPVVHRNVIFPCFDPFWIPTHRIPMLGAKFCNPQSKTSNKQVFLAWRKTGQICTGGSQTHLEIREQMQMNWNLWSIKRGICCPPGGRKYSVLYFSAKCLTCFGPSAFFQGHVCYRWNKQRKSSCAFIKEYYILYHLGQQFPPFDLRRAGHGSKNDVQP